MTEAFIKFLNKMEHYHNASKERGLRVAKRKELKSYTKFVLNDGRIVRFEEPKQSENKNPRWNPKVFIKVIKKSPDYINYDQLFSYNISGKGLYSFAVTNKKDLVCCMTFPKLDPIVCFLYGGASLFMMDKITKKPKK